MAGVVNKPNSVTDFICIKSIDDHSSKDIDCSIPLATYPETWTSSPRAFPYLVLHQVGFTKLSQSPGKLVRSYRTFSPLPTIDNLIMGGILSVALSFTLPRLRVMEHPALWCSDFPPDFLKSSDRFNYSSLIKLLHPNISFFDNGDRISGYPTFEVRYTSGAEY
jgi:hypothetical protein